ncbi:AER194Wp [Eremothecium gossypii ATCC 10895]|uniref:AER194Wp n=1 Tax=Eremothecium gossypii (strain ATCC 10895 / CBS 109.51 / FGSC 9923 / NRRL Y-1056) TaxID=284811 RepID=Q756R0_EREGS|nr:AER194Wp [Eremothecium gossypii ATCC 10895]AAS52875.1 AER194Wp [Eremothecium gossypii ATCC 10895]
MGAVELLRMSLRKCRLRSVCRRWLKEHFLAMSVWVAQWAKLCISCSMLLTLLLGYPALGTNRGAHCASGGYLSAVGQEREHPASSANSTFAQFLFRANDNSNVLSKGFLVETLAFQQRLLQDADSAPSFSKHSIFGLWGDDMEKLQLDEEPVYTVNQHWNEMPQSLLQGVMHVNSYISSAQSLSLMLLMQGGNPDRRALLDRNIKALKSVSNLTKFYLFDDAPATVASGPGDANRLLLRFTLVPLTWLDYCWIALAYIAIFAYLIYAIMLYPITKTRISLFMAVLCQYSLVLASSKTLACFLNQKATENTPWMLLYIPVLIVFCSNTVDLLFSSLGTKCTLPPAFKLRKKRLQAHKLTENKESVNQKNFFESVADSHTKSFFTLVICVLMIYMFFPFSRKTSCFISIALFTNYLLNLLSLSAILSIEQRRLTLRNNLFAKENDGILDVSLDDGYVKVNFARWWSHIIENNRVAGALWFSKSAVLLAVYFMLFNWRFSDIRSSTSICDMFKAKTSILNGVNPFYPGFLIDEAYVAREIMRSLAHTGARNSEKILYTLAIERPIFVVKDVIGNFTHDDFYAILQSFNSSMIFSYKFDGYYFLELFLSLLLIGSFSLFLLQLMSQSIESESTLSYGYSELETTKGTRGSVGLLANAIPGADDDVEGADIFHAKELAQYGHILDITYIATSASPFIVSIGMDHKVFVWSPAAKPLPKPLPLPLDRSFRYISHASISNSGLYIAIFNNFGKVTCWSRCRMDFIWTIDLREPVVTLEAFFRSRTMPTMMRKRMMRGSTEVRTPTSNYNTANNSTSRAPVSRRNSIRSITSIGTGSAAAVDSSYENPTTFFSSEELYGEDEFVFVTTTGKMYMVDIEGHMTIEQLTDGLTPVKSCKELQSPRVNDRLVLCDTGGKIYVSTVVNNAWRTKVLTIKSSFSYTNAPQGQKQEPEGQHQSILASGNALSGYANNLGDSDNTLLLVPFIGFIGRTQGSYIELVDAQTGTFIRHFKIGNFKPSSIKIFHDQPTHCKFCGSASVAFFAIAYTDKESSDFVMHVYQLESRTKNSICLRVERDPREIRCLGLESVTEKVHYVPDVEDWDVADNNAVLGIRRKPEAIERFSAGSTSLCRSRLEVCSRKNTYQRGTKTAGSKAQPGSSFSIHNIWEGWTITPSGQVAYYEIPMGTNGLIVNKIGTLKKFGNKSIVVAFGNIMKMFYLGKEELIFPVDGVSSSEEETGLKFVNKRRDRLNRKVFISPNYNRIDAIKLEH